jgi:hypothetical protein
MRGWVAMPGAMHHAPTECGFRHAVPEFAAFVYEMTFVPLAFFVFFVLFFSRNFQPVTLGS